MSSKTKGWLFFFLIFFLFGAYNGSKRKVTVKDIAREAGGKQVVSSDASETEKRGVALLRELIELRKYSEDVIDADFLKNEVGQHLLEPSTMKSPKVAAESLKTLRAYRAATAANHEKQMVAINELQVISNGAAIKPWMTGQYDAAERWFAAAEEVYAYAADPAQQAHLVKGNKVALNDPDEFNRRIYVYNEANEKFMAATAAFNEGQAKQRQSTGVTEEDLGMAKVK